MQYPLLLPHTGYSASHNCLSVRWQKNLTKRVGGGGGGFDIIFFGLTLEGKSMPLLKFFCCVDVYLKLYLILKFLGFHNHF
jgi:hypothetical protein